MIYHLKIALRTLLQGKLYTMISMLGLILGIFSCMTVVTIVIDEFSYDKQWSRSADLVRLISVSKNESDYGRKNGAAYAGLAPQLKRTFPEVQEYSELYVSPIDLKTQRGTNQHFNALALYTDSAVQKLLDVDLLAQQDLSAKGPRKIIVSEKLATTYFPDQDALGKELYDLPRYEATSNAYLIAGIMKDMPANTHLRADIIVLQDRSERPLEKEDFGMYVRHYLLLKSGTDARQLEKKINAWYRDYVTPQSATSFELQPIADTYLKSDFPAYQVHKGNIQQTYIFMGVAGLLLLIACINFVNLSTARASSRLKETGIRKVLGASRATLIRQFLLESLIVFICSTIVACFLYVLALPGVEKFIEHPLAFTLTREWPYFFALWLAVLSVSLLTGLYPAMFISGMQTLNRNLNHLISNGRNKRSRLREALVIAQFSFSIVILIALLVVEKQVNYMKNKDLGFDTDGLISINHISFDQKSEALTQRLNEHPDILSHSFTSWLPTDGAGYMRENIDDPDQPGRKTELWYIAGEPNLAQTLGLTLTDGRFLSSTRPADAIDAENYEAETNAIRPAILTTGTAARLHVHALNQVLSNKRVLPVGIVKDFNSESLHKQMVPTVIVGYRNPPYGALLVRCQPGKERQVMRRVATIWKELYPDKLLDMELITDKLIEQYKAEERIEILFRAFSTLTMLLAALGVFGLIVNTVSLRVKEIGIRKVMGASIVSVVRLISADFVKLTIIAALVASPIAWWIMDNWLTNFAYRITIQAWMFAAAGLLALTVTVLTVGLQSWRAARANPVDSLRDE